MSLFFEFEWDKIFYLYSLPYLGIPLLAAADTYIDSLKLNVDACLVSEFLVHDFIRENSFRIQNAEQILSIVSV